MLVRFQLVLSTPLLISFRVAVAFDVHIAETFVPLILGMPLHSAPRSQLLEDLPFYVQLFGITHLGIVPSLIEATMGAAEEEAGENMALRYIASGGEKMSDSVSHNNITIQHRSLCFADLG